MDLLAASPAADDRRTVRVWFGACAIASHTAPPALAERYARAMRRRFASLRVTNDPVTAPAVPPSTPGSS